MTLIRNATMERVGDLYGVPVWLTNLVERESVVVLDSEGGKVLWLHPLTYADLFPPPLWSRFTLGEKELRRDRARHHAR